MRRLLLFLLCALPALAQERTLNWDELSVKARLDATGVLHVEEKQGMVFTGDWNGGERKFDIRPRQTLKLESITRIQDGVETKLEEGSLDFVDRYAWAERNVLRWRSRAPSDPPFDRTKIAYVLRYSIASVVQRHEDHYRLAHDFAFPERDGSIYNANAELTLDPVWVPVGEAPLRASAELLGPGQSLFLVVPMRYTGSSAMELVPGTPRNAKAMIAALLLLPPLLFFAIMLREHFLGRLDPLRPEQVTRAWLEKNIFATEAEVVGALWDEDVGPSEVSALLARLVSEGKIDSRVDLGDMKMTLKVPREGLQGYVRDLVDSLFVQGDHTSTGVIRAHYKASGFDPAKIIAEGVNARAEKRLPHENRMNVWWIVPTAVFLGAAGALGLVLSREESLQFAAIVTFVAGLFGAAIAVSTTAYWRTHKNLGLGSAILRMIPAMAAAGFAAYLVYRAATLGSPEWPERMQLAVTLMALWVAVAAASALRSREGRARIAMRKMLTDAREFFLRELKKPEPALEDAWFPYVLAFGLGDDVAKWFRAFPGAEAMSSSRSSSSFGSSSSSSSSSSSWSGGGGAFGGAGATGSWAAAASGVAAGVASPSSSSSGGSSSGGGGGSSGGGGGGGW